MAAKSFGGRPGSFRDARSLPVSMKPLELGNLWLHTGFGETCLQLLQSRWAP